MTAENANPRPDDPAAGGHESRPEGVATSVGAESPRAPIADIGDPAFSGADVYTGADVFEAPTPYEGAAVFEGEPALGVADAYEGQSAPDVLGAYEPAGVYTPAVTPVAAEQIVPTGATPSSDSSQPARVGPIGVYVPEDVPAAALPQDDIARSESAQADAAAPTADPLPPAAVDPETGEPSLPGDTDAGPSAVRFDD
ncbi:hypothetical protein ELQ90_00940 [Labedella phragmitis]|uniref:Uncharacterized protein n=1 Tax=Labedella phragmitis TaxID=2498849 RepID=A0A444PXF5_9MICO|nr:hypothetical protein [Labedella phragmitis]RWZ52556.1 hypothetical protein ELQ90_00940 [Labedella phragmitis]